MQPEESRNIIKQILKHFGDQQRFLVPGGKPSEAMAGLDQASKLADQLPDEVKGFLNSLVEMYREQALALAEQKEGADLDSVQRRLLTALDHLRHAREEYPNMDETTESLLDNTRTGLEIQLRSLESLTTRPPDESPADARARRRRLIEEAISALPSDDPSRRSLEGLSDFNDAWEPFEESVSAQVRMNLEDATRYIENASSLLHRAEDAWNGDDSPYVRPLQSVGRGFRMLIDAQRSYVQTLRDAVVGDVTNKHVAALTVADDELIEGLKQIETWGPRIVEFSPQVGEEFDIPTLRAAVGRQREVLRNFRAIVSEGTRATQVLLRATPRFLAYFVISFLVILFGSEWSGLVPQLDITGVAGIALTVSVFSAYGFDAGRQVLSTLWPGHKSGGSENEAA